MLNFNFVSILFRELANLSGLECFLMDKCLKSDFTFQMASSLPSTTLRKNMERSGVSSALPHHLTTTDAVTGKCFPDMS